MQHAHKCQWQREEPLDSYGQDAGRLRVGIVGAGLGGVAAAVHLIKRGHSDIEIFERSEKPGGVWFDNTYPGCGVDIHSHAYSYSFMKYQWKRTHATQPELQQYVEDTIDEFDLRSKIHFNTTVKKIEWDDDRDLYRMELEDGSAKEFEVVVSAVGFLINPKFPTWPGMDKFKGAMMHTSRWDHSIDLKNKTVAVVGTGSTSAQVVPGIANDVGKLLVFQREPGYVGPKNAREYSPFERFLYDNVPGMTRLSRTRAFTRATIRNKGFDENSRRQQLNKEICVANITDHVDDPVIQKQLTPEYPWGCKRQIESSEYYPTFNLPQVHLVPRAVRELTEDAIIDMDGNEHKVDAIIMATGFETTKYLSSIEVTGENGLPLKEAWKRRAAAFVGVTVPKFPNFFILYGPNTHGGYSVIAQLECAARVAARAVRKMKKKGWSRINTPQKALDDYIEWLDEKFRTAGSAMIANCNNYYTNESGDNVTNWPLPNIHYAYMTTIRPYFDLVGTPAKRRDTASIGARPSGKPQKGQSS
ncbi:MAG: NAD(P)/FAD-dependent oxidoreductase [Pseudomonadota bacterium]